MKLLRILIVLFTLAAFLPAQTPIDINTAPAATLKTIPGIGDAYADKIIKGRPYKGKDELVEKKILPQSVYDGLKDELVARQKN